MVTSRLRRRLLTGPRVIFDPALTSISATSASASARNFDEDESVASSIWNIVLEASSFLLTIVPMLRFSAGEINCRSSTSAIVFFIPCSLAVSDASIFVSDRSVRAMKASISSIPSSSSVSMSRASPLTIFASGQRSQSFTQRWRSISMILNLYLSPAIAASLTAMRLPPITSTLRMFTWRLPHISRIFSIWSRVVVKYSISLCMIRSSPRGMIVSLRRRMAATWKLCPEAARSFSCMPHRGALPRIFTPTTVSSPSWMSNHVRTHVRSSEVNISFAARYSG